MCLSINNIIVCAMKSNLTLIPKPNCVGVSTLVAMNLLAVMSTSTIRWYKTPPIPNDRIHACLFGSFKNAQLSAPFRYLSV